MDKLTISPDTAGYGYGYDEEFVRAYENGGAGRYASGILNAAVVLSVTWTVGKADYNALCAANQQHIDEGGAPFLMDLIIEKCDVREYLVRILPGSFGLSNQSQDTYTVNADIEAEPTPLRQSTALWPADLLVT